jgi:lipopolysaccharide/colanic/teichoic acid biosynthesis glycosyltransferase
MTDTLTRIKPSLTAIHPGLKNQVDWFCKRAFDVLAAFWGLVFLVPFFLLIAYWIKRESLGPVFYRGPRMGKDGKVFGILKFRTMREEPASYEGPSVTAQDDPRITPLGKWLRETKVNELPQLWNVLVGEMSLVGPRPEDPQIAAAWPEEVRREILSVRPGITSPATVAYHDEEKRLQAASVMEEYISNILPDKLRLDQLYVRHHTFMTDLDAIFWTFVILIPRLGDQKISEGWLFGGPLTRIVRRYVSWTAVDFLTALAGIGLAGALWRLSGPLDIGLWRSVQLAVLLAILFGLCNALLGLNMVAWSRAAAEDAARLVVSCGLVTLLVAAIQTALAPAYGIPLRFMYTAGLLVLAGFIAVRYRLRLVTGLASRWISLRRSGYGAGERVLVVGAGDGSQFATWLLRRRDFHGLYTIAGIADDAPNKQGMRYDGVRVLGTTADIPELVRQHDIGVIFFAIAKISPADSRRILAACKRTGRRLVMLSDVLRTLHTRLAKELPHCERVCPYLVGVDSLGEAEDGVEGPG